MLDAHSDHSVMIPIDQSETMQNSGQQQEHNTVQKFDVHEPEEHKDIVHELKRVGANLRSDKGQPELLSKPIWFDETLFNDAKSAYARHFMAVNFAHLAGLLLLVRVDSIFNTLSSTGKSDSVSKLFNRYYQTIMHIKKWYEGDIFDENSDAHKSLMIVRGMHNSVCRNFNDGQDATIANGKHADYVTNGQADSQKCNNSRQPIHLSEYDIMVTQFAFIGFIVMHPKSVGFIDDFSEHDLISILHFWRVIGYYLGASEKLNLCSRKLDAIKGMCEAIKDIEFKQSIRDNPISSPPGIMSVNIVRSVKFIPMITIYGMLKYLYELLEIDTSEFNSRATWYSRLSHYLIELVMRKLLRFKLLRMFNNGLTRLSLHLVGKHQHRFAASLNSKYGNGLKSM